MDLVFLRHGIAWDRLDPDCPPDPERPLTERGRTRTEGACRGLRALGVAPDLVLSSPYLRCRQTAEIAARLLADGSDVRDSRNLAPGGDPDELLGEVAASGADEVLLVGHAPDLDLLLAAGLGASGEEPTRLKKAGAARVEAPEGIAGGWRLVWLLEPRALRHLGAVADG